ncbi:MerR family transcriptional regulator [Deinococcus sp.]|uniref:MerR family transcriptional regulator n=1 Tax=Deinococcus sp. TaxID=47478 RepID=UPI003CC5DFE2
MTASPSPSTTALYTAHEVELRSGIPATTLRQWERRYGFPAPARSAGGYRMYSPLDLACLAFIRARQDEGVPVSRAVDLMRAHLSAPFEPPAFAARTSALVQALILPDHAEATRLLAQAHAELGTEEVMFSLMQPALMQLGVLWERGEITVAHEHLASAYLRSRVSHLLEAAGQNVFGPAVVAACGPGEFHEIGLMMLAVVLRRRGVRVHYLGANTPLADIALYARHVQAEALLISLNTHASLDAFQGEQHELAELKVPLYLGGAMLNEVPGLAPELGATYLGGGALAAAEALVERLGKGLGERLGVPQGALD